MATYNDIEHFLESYMHLKRNTLKNKFVQFPKNDKKFMQAAADIVDLIEEIHADPIDFLKFMVKYYSPMRVFPSLGHLKALKAVGKYQYHQALANRYVYPDCDINHDELTILKTWETVSYKNDIMCPIDKDIRLRSIMFIGKQKDYTLTETDKRDVEYAIVKFKLLGKEVPPELLRLRDN